MPVAGVESLPAVRITRAAALEDGAGAATTGDAPLPASTNRLVPALKGAAGEGTPLSEGGAANPPYKIKEGEDGGDESGDDADQTMPTRVRRKRRKSSERRRLGKGQIGLCTEVRKRSVDNV